MVKHPWDGTVHYAWTVIFKGMVITCSSTENMVAWPVTMAVRADTSIWAKVQGKLEALSVAE